MSPFSASQRDRVNPHLPLCIHNKPCPDGQSSPPSINAPYCFISVMPNQGSSLQIDPPCIKLVRPVLRSYNKAIARTFFFWIRVQPVISLAVPNKFLQ